SLDADYRQIRRQLIGMARALQTGATERLARTTETPETPAVKAVIPTELKGYHLMTQQLALNLDGLQARLAKTAKRWKF
ncbi:FUSC family protein, partial [Pseudomonas syringae]|nr:FUSC family protein [Pseudomonas syringae]